MSSHEVNEKKYKLHVQPEDCVMDHKYSIFEDGEVVVMMNTLERYKDKPKELVEKLNAYPDLVAENERLRRALEAVKLSGENCARLHASKYSDVTIAAVAYDEVIAALSTEPARRG